MPGTGSRPPLRRLLPPGTSQGFILRPRPWVTLRGPVGARWPQVLACFGRARTCELSRMHLWQLVGLGLAVGLGAHQAGGQAGQRMDPILILSFDTILVLSVGRRPGGRQLPCRGCHGSRLGGCTGMLVSSERNLNYQFIISHPAGLSICSARGSCRWDPSVCPRPLGATCCAKTGIPWCPHPHSRQQVGSLEPLEPLLQDLRHRLAAALPHVRGHRRAGLPLRGHRRGGEDLQREEVPRYRAPPNPPWCPSPHVWAAPEPPSHSPAYHEMCKDEYVMLMTWKKTAAGEIIYNKCPPNATGKGCGASTPQPPTPWSRAGGGRWRGGAERQFLCGC